MKREKINARFPVAVTLRFRSEEERDYFMGQLSDGWGENHCSLQWQWESVPEEELRTGAPFRRQAEFGVEIPDGDMEKHRERVRRVRELFKKYHDE